MIDEIFYFRQRRVNAINCNKPTRLVLTVNKGLKRTAVYYKYWNAMLLERSVFFFLLLNRQ